MENTRGDSNKDIRMDVVIGTGVVNPQPPNHQILSAKSQEDTTHKKNIFNINYQNISEFHNKKANNQKFSKKLENSQNSQKSENSKDPKIPEQEQNVVIENEIKGDTFSIQSPTIFDTKETLFHEVSTQNFC